MAFTTHLLRVFLREQKLRPLTGKGLFIGRQSVLFSGADLVRIAGEEGVPLRNVSVSADDDTRAGGELNDFELFAHFSDIEFDALDVTDYEKANVIHDMNVPVPESLAGQYDFVFNGSCMDNLFNPSEFLRNCSRLLKAGGRMVHTEHASSWPGSYLLFTPDWFLDFFCINNYRDATVFLCDFVGFKGNHHVVSPWHLWNWNPLYQGLIEEHSMHMNPSNRLILAIAEKGEDTTDERQPLQGIYRSNPSLVDPLYVTCCERYKGSPRIDAYKTAQGVDWGQSPAISNLRFVGSL